MKLFVAIGFDQKVREGLESFRPADASDWFKTRWVEKDKLHITLRFIGQASQDRAEHIRSSLHQIRFTPFDVAVFGAGTFGRRKSPTVLWAGIRDCSELIDLSQNISHIIDDGGMDKKDYPFVPHITLARFGGRKPVQLAPFLNKNERFYLSSFTVNRFTLYHSRFDSGHIQYDVIEHYPANDQAVMKLVNLQAE